MAHGMQIATIRLIVLILALLAQVYLFVHIRRAIKSLPVSGGFKSCAVVLAGMAIVVLFSANRYFTFNPVTWAEPPEAGRVVLVYASAVWTFGSILSALVLFVVHFAGRLGRMAAGIFHRVSRIEPVPAIRAAAAFLSPGCTA